MSNKRNGQPNAIGFIALMFSFAIEGEAATVRSKIAIFFIMFFLK
jgi:hypothetical protein